MNNKSFHFVTYVTLGYLLLTGCKEMNVSRLPNTNGFGIDDFESLPYDYPFISPLESDWLCRAGYQFQPLAGPILVGPQEPYCTSPVDYQPAMDHRYFISVFGPRMRASDGDISEAYDFHLGEDIVDGDIPPKNALPEIRCMCSGTVYRIFTEDDIGKCEDIEDTPTGNYVTIRCNADYANSDWGNIYIAYRHLSSINTNLQEGESITRGAVIGRMGKTGVTTNPHLHLSAQRLMNGELINLHPMRLFNPYYNRHLLSPIDAQPLSQNDESRKNERVNMFLLDMNSTGNPVNNFAIFRIAVPYKKANIRAIIIKAESYFECADFEAISRQRDDDEDELNNPAVGNLQLYVFPFNRGQSAYNRFDRIRVDLNNYTHTGNQFPILEGGIFNTPAYVIDVRANQLPANFSETDLEVIILDIWGNGMRGSLRNPFDWIRF